MSGRSMMGWPDGVEEDVSPERPGQPPPRYAEYAGPTAGDSVHPRTHPDAIEDDPIFLPRTPVRPREGAVEARSAFDLSLDVVSTLRILVARRWMIAVLTAAAIVGGMVYTYFQPPTYTARVSLLPNSSGEGLGAMGIGQVAGLASNLGINLGGPSVSAAYPDIIRSRQVRERVLDRRFSTRAGVMTLQQHLDPAGRTTNARRAQALSTLEKRMRLSVDKLSGVMALSVTMGEPRLATAVAEAIVAELVRVEEEVRLAAAQYNKAFIEQRLQETSVVLAEAENALKSFRQQNLRIGNAPELLLQAARLERAVAIQEQVYLTLTQQHELAKIEEERRGPGVQVLDPAREPLQRSGPILLKNLVLSGFLGAITACILAVGLTWWRAGRRQVLWSAR